jgi:hypothetical protein
MSSYIKKLKHPKTGKEVEAFCLDDFYGSHINGYGFRKDGGDSKINDDMSDFYFYRFEDLK